jgi:hypothetical protein
MAAGQDRDIPWNAQNYIMEFRYFSETGSFTPETWQSVPAMDQKDEIDAVREKAGARYTEVDEYYSRMMQKWDIHQMKGLMNSAQVKDLSSVSLWLGEEKRGALEAKISTLKLCLQKANGRGLDESDTAAAAPYLEPEAINQLESIKLAKTAQADMSAQKKKMSLKESASGGGLEQFSQKKPSSLDTGRLSQFYDGGKSGSPAADDRAGAQIDKSGAAEISALKMSPKATTIKHTTPGELPGATSREPGKSDAPKVWTSQENGSKAETEINKVHAAVWKEYKDNKIGTGHAGSLAGNFYSLPYKTISDSEKTVKEKLSAIPVAILVPIVVPVAAAYDKISGWFQKPQPLPDTTGIKAADLSSEKFTPGEIPLMKCYQWREAVTDTVNQNPQSKDLISREYKMQEVYRKPIIEPSKLNFQAAHQYVVFTSNNKILISDPWTYGPKLMEVPNTPANRKKYLSD